MPTDPDKDYEVERLKFCKKFKRLKVGESITVPKIISNKFFADVARLVTPEIDRIRNSRIYL